VTRKKGAWFLFHSEHSTGCAAVNQLTEVAAGSPQQPAVSDSQEEEKKATTQGKMNRLVERESLKGSKSYCHEQTK
jgi:hypothetical protein